jgi:hypothetical protein
MDSTTMGALLLLVIAIAAVVYTRIPAGSGTGRGLTLFASAIAVAEGFGVPGAIPTVRNNPGDLKLDGVTITTFPTEQAGWDALVRQLRLIRDGQSRYYTPDMTLAQMGRVWTATEQESWSANVMLALRGNGLTDVTLETPLSRILNA